MIHTLLESDSLIWIGIALCLSQSALFSGLNLAIFSISRLRLEVRAASGDRDAARVLALRKHFNFTLATVLWSNVALNVCLTLLSHSVLAGLSAFFFSTVVITAFGEIAPQAYFSRHALRMASKLEPWLRAYQVLLYPVAKPTALLLDAWLGPEAIPLFRESDFRALLTKHVEAESSDLGPLEAAGALNFLDLDDIKVLNEGEPVDPRSVIVLPIVNGRAVLPKFEPVPGDSFLRQLDASGRKWVIITDASNVPRLVLDAHRFLRDALFQRTAGDPEAYFHRPIVITDSRTRLGDVIGRMRVRPEHPEDDVIDDDLVLVWSEQHRIITGADLLGRLLRGIARTVP
jgi:hypothetical protein